jgi:hypothetical protein
MLAIFVDLVEMGEVSGEQKLVESLREDVLLPLDPESSRDAR